VAAAIAARIWLAVPALAPCALALGALTAVAPTASAGLLVVALVAVAAFRFPAAHLTALLVLTTVVPFGVQNRLSGGPGAGLFLSDVLLMTGLLRSGIAMLDRPLDGRRTAAIGMTLAVITGVLVQFAHGVSAVGDVSQAGGEARALLGLGTFLVALPILDDAACRRRLVLGLGLVGLLLGLWGIAQWVLDIRVSGIRDVGVRPGVSDTTAGRGQVQGGLFGFPVAIIMGSALLVSAQRLRLRLRSRAVVLAIVLLNAVSALLTYERTFWVGTLAGLALVILGAGQMQRLKGLAWTVVIFAVAFACLSTFAPSTMTAARERFLSLGQYAASGSLRDRRVEAAHVVAEIQRHPVGGSGLAARIFWGRTWVQEPPRSTAYAHNGYLVLAWKLGIPLAVLVLALLALAFSGRRRADLDPLGHALANGARGALLALAVVNVTFPAFATLAITAAIGVLLAAAVSPPLRDGSEPTISGPRHARRVARATPAGRRHSLAR
jgi:O-antigen ligase/polysaccharide polymerase Wzy-like membrane protein